MEKVFDAVDPVADEPSPKSHAYEATGPSVSDDAVPLKLTACGAMPEDGVAVKLAVGATFGAEMVAVRVVEAVPPLLSVTVSVTVKVPPAV